MYPDILTRVCSISSIVSQDYKNLEIILINDGSTDDSLQRCQKWAMKDKRIICFDQKNCGLGAARNRGVRLAHGEYVTFVDPDDTIEPDCVSVLYSILNERHAEVSVANMDYGGSEKRIFLLKVLNCEITGDEELNLLSIGKFTMSF